ncbi:MAG: metal ABC transporter permease [Acholeplasmatales bacterium]|nr:MAG: metal ABC transporter permease [Acholeplasmatales bacterium]
MMTWLELLRAAFTYGFMWRALIVGVSIALSSAFIGSFLVLKRFSMIGHGLSHVAFAAVAIGLFFDQAPLLITLPMVVLTAVLVLKLNESADVHGDAAIGLAAAFSMALGTTLASIGGGFNLDLYSYLFGSILTIKMLDLWLAIGLSLIVLVTVFLFFEDLFTMTFDESFAQVSGIRTKRLNTLLAVLTGLVIVIGIRAIGTLLISSLIIFPTVIAMQFSKGFKATILIAVISSVIIVFVGLIGSFLFDLPSGSAIVLLNGIVFFFVYVYHRLIKR